jgi:hypothetical protein
MRTGTTTVRRARFLPLLALMAAGCIAAFAMTSAASAEEAVPASPDSALAGCEGGWVCAWFGEGMTGGEPTGFTCDAAYEQSHLGFEFKSAKNNCGANAAEIGWKEGGSVNWKACMNPGGNERPNPGRFNTVKVLAAGSC